MCEIEVSNIVVVEERIEFERSWAHLPDLVLSKISSRIVVDRHRINFSLVCKSWNSILQSPIKTKQQFQLNTIEPHLFFTKNKLIHPILETVYKLDKFPERILGVKLCAVNEDWMLFTQNYCHPAYTSNYSMPSKAFFFNPFTLAIIWLPDILDNLRNSMCFSSTPSSADFKVFVVRSTHEHSVWKEITIDTVKCGENKWTSSTEFEFKNDSLFRFSHCTPIIYKGMCYILAEDSTLLIHDPNKETFFCHQPPEFLCCNVREQYMLESDRKLLAVFVETSGSWVLVCRWNVSKRKWEKVESLGNKVLFVSRPYSLSETVCASELGNRIYFPRLVGDHCLFYSLYTKRFHTSDGSSFTTFHGSDSAFSSTWIKPSCAKTIS